MYGAFLVSNRRVISDKPRLWEHGPSFSKIYDFSVKHQLMPTDDFLELFLSNKEEFYSHFSDSDLKLMNSVLKVFCNYNARQLVDWSMGSKGPWRQELDSGIPLHSEMSDESITEYFKTFVR